VINSNADRGLIFNDAASAAVALTASIRSSTRATITPY
jgi:hypothetical protein